MQPWGPTAPLLLVGLACLVQCLVPGGTPSPPELGPSPPRGGEKTESRREAPWLKAPPPPGQKEQSPDERPAIRLPAGSLGCIRNHPPPQCGRAVQPALAPVGAGMGPAGLAGGKLWNCPLSSIPVPRSGAASQPVLPSCTALALRDFCPCPAGGLGCDPRQPWASAHPPPPLVLQDMRLPVGPCAWVGPPATPSWAGQAAGLLAGRVKGLQAPGSGEAGGWNQIRVAE